MRLTYIPSSPQMSAPSDQEIVTRIKDRRGGNLIALDKTLLHSPPLADGWNSFLKAVRTQTSLSDSIRELSICRIACLNSAWYEWDQHSPLLLQSQTFPSHLLEHLKNRDWDGEGLDEKHRAVLKYTDAMTKDVIVREAVFQELKRHFSEREVVEITGTVAAYNTVSRFLVALDVGEMAEKYGVDMK